MEKGSYLITTDGGETLFLVDPEEKTYTEWDLRAMMNMVGAVMEGMGGMFQIEISDPEVEKLLEENGETIVGLPTTHYRYRTAYTMDMKIMGMRRDPRSVEMVQDIWSTEEVADPALAVWLKREPPTMGNTGLEKLIDTEMSKMKGFPDLKTDPTESISTGQKGKHSVTKTSPPWFRARTDDPSQAEHLRQFPPTTSLREHGSGEPGGGRRRQPLQVRTRRVRARDVRGQAPGAQDASSTVGLSI